VLLGKLVDVLQTGSNDVYGTREAKGREILIPALKDVILTVDLEGGVMTVKLPDGLLDLN
jgi:16S rRNA processing protein RimM